MGFASARVSSLEGMNKGKNMVLNIASISHDKYEASNVTLNTFPLN